MSMNVNLIAHIVSFNDEETIVPALASLIEQENFVIGDNFHIILSDNNSSDGTLELVREYFGNKIQIVSHKKNTGFCRAHNLCFTKAVKAEVDYVFIANPDLRLEKNALSELVYSLENDKSAGLACPKLLRADENLDAVKPERFDSTGMFITPGIRHFDRGSNEIARNRFENAEYVFGASGAAVLFRKDFLKDIALSNKEHLEVFDESFFAYREDADLAWRTQLLGWRCRYEPAAVGYHKRHVLPEKRKRLAKELNSMSVRNRFLLQLNNLAPSQNLKCLIPALIRNALVVGASCSIERSSFKGLRESIKELPLALKKRFFIKRKKTNPASDVNRWFSNTPYSEPAPSFRKSEEIENLEIIIINYNSGERLESCVNNLLPACKGLEVNYKIIVIDNASQDTSATRVVKNQKNNPFLEVQLLKTNLGFAGGINKASTLSSADALLILNPDIEIGTKCIREQINCLNNHKDVGVVGPVLNGTDGEVQKGFLARRFPTLGSTLAELFFLHKLWKNNPWTSRYLYKNDKELEDYLQSSSNVPHYVDQPAGCSLMIRKKAFDQLKGFDESFYPAWFEDVDFCKRLAKTNHRAAIVSSATAVHEGGYSYKLLRSANYYRIWYRNLKRYFSKHESKRVNLTLRFALVPALTLRAIVAIVFKKEEKVELARELISIGFEREEKRVGNL